MLKYIVSLLLILYCFGGKSQDLIYSSFTSDDGLPGNEVFDLLKDDSGRIWGGTDGGVFCYDGHSFKIYTTENGLSDNSVLRLYLDKKGRIWMSCFNGTICYFENNQIKKLACNKKIQTILGGLFITSIYIDEANTLWLGYPSGCIFIDSKSDYKYPQSIDIGENLTNYNRFILKNADGTSCLTYSLSKIRNNQNEVVLEINDKKILIDCNKFGIAPGYSNIEKVLPLSNDTIYFSIRNALLRYDGKKIESIKKFEHTITSIFKYKNQIWVGSLNDGIHVLNKDGLDSSVRFLIGLSISSMVLDQEGGIWIGTIGEGLFYCPNPNIWLYKNTQLKGTGMVSLKVNEIENILYGINENSALISIASIFSTFQILAPDNGNRIDAAAIFVESEKLYFASNKSGNYDLTNGNFLFYSYNDIGVSATDIISVKEKVYLATYQNLMQIDQKEVQKFKSPSRTRCLFHLDSDRILVGTLNGVFVFSDGKFTPFFSDIFENERINRIDAWDDHLLFSTASSGVKVVNRSGKVLFTVNEKNGLASNNCFQSAYKNGKLWVISKRGLSAVDLNTKDYSIKSISNYSLADGLPANEIHSMAFQNGYLWLATRKGLCCITDLSSLENNSKPLLNIHRIYLNNLMRKVTDGMELSYTENNIRLEWRTSAFRKSDKAGCWYILKGYDERLRFSNDGKIQYENLPPGEFELLVTPVNNQGIKGEKVSVFRFTILAPFWMKVWFWLCIVLLLTVLIFVLFRWRMKLLKQSERKKAAVEKQITELRLMATRAQMNPHFIFNAINGIQRFILEKKTDEAYRYLTRFSKLIRYVLENASENTHTLKKEIEIIQLYVELEQLRFENNFQFECVSSDQLDLESITIPSLLLQPLVENSIWHGLLPVKDQISGKIRLEIFKKEDKLVILVSDNGIGMQEGQKKLPEGKNKSMGLQMVRDRLNLAAFGSELLMESEQGKGTRITIIIPLLNLEEDESRISG